MTEEKKEAPTPQEGGEQTPKSNPAEEALKAELAEKEKKLVELQAQKEHWREKYERDIASQQPKEPAPSEEEIYSDEGKQLKGQISALNEEIASIKRKEARREVESEFPVLKDKKTEFDAFLEDEENKRLSILKAAKLFLAEKNLLASETSERKGLEAPTGGGTKAPQPTITNEELEKMRETDYRKYEKLIREKKI